LVALVFTGISGAITYAMKGSIDLTASLLIAITAIFTARAGAHYAHNLAEEKTKAVIWRFYDCSIPALADETLFAAMWSTGTGLDKNSGSLGDRCSYRVSLRHDGSGRGKHYGFLLWCCWQDLLSTPRKEAPCLPWFLPVAWALLPTGDWAMSTRS